MTTSFSDTALSALVGGLSTLETLVDKSKSYAEDKEIDPDALLQARLFPDMFTFTKNILAATDTAWKTVARLTNNELDTPEHPEATFAALGAYLKATIAHVENADRALVDASESREFTVPMGPGVTMEFNGRTYTQSFAIPNFLFHVVTAYNILRHNGVEVGKRDYLTPFMPGYKPL